MRNMAQQIQTGNEVIAQKAEKNASALSQQIRVESEAIKVQIARAMDPPWDPQAVCFQDALGRRFPIPLEVCETFEVSKFYIIEYLRWLA